MARPNRAQINLDALRHNVAVARALAPESKLMAVVKANAYGHGAVTIARALEPLVDALAVACIEEAEELRAAAIEAPILLLEGVFAASELQRACEQDLWLTIATSAHIDWLEAASLPRPLRCWLKVDTGMHRLGVSATEAAQCCARLKACPNVADALVLYTHFAAADDTTSAQTRAQLAAFDASCNGLTAERSAANSAGLLAWPEAHYDWVRPGYMLYGNSPMLQPHPNAQALQPVMTLTSAVIAIHEVPAGSSVGYGATWTAQRPSRIATVTIGYGDGYPRLAPNGTPVIINGQRAPLAGRVSMDMLTVDVTDLPEVSIGAAVELWGPQLALAEVAHHAGTIGYELTTRMPARTPRVTGN